jgi:peroxiredoxin (alkyl hydroperoxide reductase subunit C)
MTCRIGKPAPDFEATAYVDGDFETIRLSDYKGRWVFICFYPADFTFVCPTELAAIAAKYPDFKNMGVEVLAISTDSRFTHKMWQEEELSKMVPGGVPFPMLSDPRGQIGTTYNVYDEDTGMNVRGDFVIDPDGTIQAMEALSHTVGRNVNEMLRELRAFQHVRNTGEMTPAGWQPDQPGLSPGSNLVGRVWEVWTPESIVEEA